MTGGEILHFPFGVQKFSPAIFSLLPCHSGRSEESRPLVFLKDFKDEILRALPSGWQVGRFCIFLSVFKSFLRPFSAFCPVILNEVKNLALWSFWSVLRTRSFGHCPQDNRWGDSAFSFRCSKVFSGHFQLSALSFWTKWRISSFGLFGVL